MKRAHGFTLVEMLVVMAIIGILATMLMGTLFWATEKARATRTQALIRKIDLQLGMLVESYETLRIPLTIDMDAVADPKLDNTARAKLIFLRELMRMELPDLYEDLQLRLVETTLPEVGFDWTDLPDGCTRPNDYIPSTTRTYQQRVLSNARSLVDAGEFADIHDAVTAMQKENQSAEMLYLVMTATGGEDDYGPHFGAKDTGDTDGDGMPELVDAWGQPIEWIRWPAGFANFNSIAGAADWGYVSDRINIEAYNSPDPFNHRSIDLPPTTDPVPAMSPPVPRYGYLLHPLVISPGPDGEYGIVFRRKLKENDTDPEPPDAEKSQLRQQYSDPYYFWQERTTGLYRRRGMPARWSWAKNAFDDQDTADDGDPMGEWAHLDNITNHLTGE